MRSEQLTEKVRSIDRNEGISAQIPRSCKLLRLPEELILMIFESLDGLMAMICFCLAHNNLGLICEYKINDLLLQELSPWAGQPIVCVADTTVGDVYPPGIAPYVQAARHRALAQNGGAEAGMFSFIDFIARNYEAVPHRLANGRPFLSRLADRALPTEKMRRNPVALDMDKVNKLALDLLQVLAQFPGARDQVLCNVSKGEYVRGDAVADLDDIIQQDATVSLSVSLGTVLWSMIRWDCRNPEFPVSEVGKSFSHGPWAGDGFEITTLERLRGGIAWKDVTGNVLAWFIEIYRQQRVRLDDDDPQNGPAAQLGGQGPGASTCTVM